MMNWCGAPFKMWFIFLRWGYIFDWYFTSTTAASITVVTWGILFQKLSKAGMFIPSKHLSFTYKIKTSWHNKKKFLSMVLNSNPIKIIEYWVPPLLPSGCPVCVSAPLWSVPSSSQSEYGQQLKHNAEQDQTNHTKTCIPDRLSY